MANTPYFPTFESQFTQTPNLFFDSILPKAKASEIRIVGYLIRHTLGYNNKAGWTGISRNDLAKRAGVSKSEITKSLQSCEEQSWILTYVEGDQGKEQRFIFLNNETNVRIVAGLKLGFFTVGMLKNLNEAGIKEILDMHNLQEIPLEDLSVPTRGVGNRPGMETDPVKGVGNRPGTGSVSDRVNEPQSQSGQGLSSTLNTSFKNRKDKYKSSKNNNKKERASPPSSAPSLSSLEINAEIIQSLKQTWQECEAINAAFSQPLSDSAVMDMWENVDHIEKPKALQLLAELGDKAKYIQHQCLGVARSKPASQIRNTLGLVITAIREGYVLEPGVVQPTPKQHNKYDAFYSAIPALRR